MAAVSVKRSIHTQVRLCRRDFCDGAKLRCAWPAPDSETVGSAKLRKHEHEKKTEGIFFTHHALIFSRSFQ